MTKKYLIGTEPTGDNLTNFWLIQNMLDFENLGFSKTVESIKFLICADCEIGPLGWHNLQAPNEFYISCERVKYGHDWTM